MPYIEDVLPELGEAAFNPKTDVKEMFELSGTQPGGGDTFSVDSAEAVMVFIIDWRKARAFKRWCLGFSYADRGFPYRIHRENPQQHPRWPKLRAATVHFGSVAPKANDEGTGKPQINSPNYPAVLPDPNGIGKQAYYDSCFCTVRYTRRDWEFLEDRDLADISQPLQYPATELWRNCTVTTEPVVDLLTAEGGMAQLKWIEGSVGGAEAGAVIANSFSIRVAKVRYQIQWNWVPLHYLSLSSQFPFYTKLFSCNSKVNSKPFFGLPAGTLLCDPPRVERFQFPVSTFTGRDAFWGCNVTIRFTYFNPTLGVPDTNPADDNKARGWRTYPSSRDGKWYGAKRETTSDPQTQWNTEEADFNKMIEHISAP